MEIKDEFMEELGKANVFLQQYVNDQIELAKIQVAEQVATVISTMLLVSILGSISFIVFFILTAIIVLQLQEWIADIKLALGILGLFYGVVALLVFSFRKRLFVRPILLKSVQKIYE